MRLLGSGRNVKYSRENDILASYTWGDPPTSLRERVRREVKHEGPDKRKPPTLLKNVGGKMEREKGFEPSTLALARRCFTTELFPRNL